MRRTMTSRKTVSRTRTVLPLTLGVALLVVIAPCVMAQTPSPTPPDNRGLGIDTGAPTNTSQATQQAREAKPELVLQTGYNNFFGATRIVFSPDGRLIATATFRSSTIKLWETATGRELRNLSSGTQSATGTAPSVAFSRDGRVVAAATGNNSVKIWDVTSGRELQTLSGGEASMASSIAGIYFIGFTPDGRVVTISDAIKVWDLASGQVLRAFGSTSLSVSGFSGGDGGAALSPDGRQLATVNTTGEKPQIKFWEIASGREVRSVDLPDKEIHSAEVCFTSDGRVLFAGVIDRRMRLWDITGKQTERDLSPTVKDFNLIKFSRDGRLVALSESYNVKIWETTTGRELPAPKLSNSGIYFGANA